MKGTLDEWMKLVVFGVAILMVLTLAIMLFSVLFGFKEASEIRIDPFFFFGGFMYLSFANGIANPEATVTNSILNIYRIFKGGG